MKSPRVRKADLMLMAVIVISAGILFLLSRAGAGKGAYAAVYVDGVLQTRYPLDTELSVTLTGTGGVNDLVIEDGYAYLTDADCPDRLCVKEGKISKNGESIICLPHRLVITVEGGADADVDVIAQ